MVKGIKSEWRIFTVLLKHFSLRLYNNDILKFEDNRRESFIILMAMLTMMGGAISHHLVHVYLFLNPLLSAQSIWVEKTDFLTMTMALTGIISVINWNIVFLDKKDFNNLLGLPVKMGSLFLSKLCSLLLFVGLISAVFNFIPIFIFTAYLSKAFNVNPFYFGLSHFLSSLLANLFVFFLVVVIQSILMILFKQELFQRISGYVQSLLLVGFIVFFFWYPMVYPDIGANYPPVSELKETLAPFIFYYPPIWFVGFYEKLLGSTDPVFGMHFYTTLIAISVVIGLYLVSFPIALKKFQNYSETERKKLKLSKYLIPMKKAFDAIFLANPVQRAIYYFSLNTLWRTRRLKFLLSMYLAFPIGKVIFGMAYYYLKSGYGAAYLGQVLPFLIADTMNLNLFLIMGLRMAAVQPVMLEANWLFRITENPEPEHYIKGLKKMFFTRVILPVYIPVYLFFLYYWGGGLALYHTAFSLVVALLLMEVFFIGFRKMPFSSQYVPGKAKLKTRWPFYLVGYTVYITVMEKLGYFLLKNPVYYTVFYTAVVIFFIGMRAYQNHKQKKEIFKIIYEEEAEEEMASLRIT
ncbi:MAG: hypothetical protein GY757_45620 [bacterium]|nr:hypothetical protein [bacterium]